MADDLRKIVILVEAPTTQEMFSEHLARAISGRGPTVVKNNDVPVGELTDSLINRLDNVQGCVLILDETSVLSDGLMRRLQDRVLIERSLLLIPIYVGLVKKERFLANVKGIDINPGDMRSAAQVESRAKEIADQVVSSVSDFVEEREILEKKEREAARLREIERGALMGALASVGADVQEMAQRALLEKVTSASTDAPKRARPPVDGA